VLDPQFEQTGLNLSAHQSFSYEPINGSYNTTSTWDLQGHQASLHAFPPGPSTYQGIKPYTPDAFTSISSVIDGEMSSPSVYPNTTASQANSRFPNKQVPNIVTQGATLDATSADHNGYASPTSAVTSPFSPRSNPGGREGKRQIEKRARIKEQNAFRTLDEKVRDLPEGLREQALGLVPSNYRGVEGGKETAAKGKGQSPSTRKKTDFSRANLVVLAAYVIEVQTKQNEYLRAENEMGQARIRELETKFNELQRGLNYGQSYKVEPAVTPQRMDHGKYPQAHMDLDTSHLSYFSTDLARG